MRAFEGNARIEQRYEMRRYNSTNLYTNWSLEASIARGRREIIQAAFAILRKSGKIVRSKRGNDRIITAVDLAVRIQTSESRPGRMCCLVEGCRKYRQRGNDGLCRNHYLERERGRDESHNIVRRTDLQRDETQAEGARTPSALASSNERGEATASDPKGSTKPPSVRSIGRGL